MTPPGAEAAADTPTCASRGCRADATSLVLWNNPRLHAPERRKAWPACQEHVATLSDFLDRRGFLRAVEPLGAADGPVEGATTTPGGAPVTPASDARDDATGPRPRPAAD